MRLLLVLGALVAVATASKFNELVRLEWETHKLTHNLNFNNASEDEFRLNVYVDNRIDIAKHNAKFARGEVQFKLGVNQFAHMLNEEVTGRMNGYGKKGTKLRISTQPPPSAEATASKFNKSVRLEWETHKLTHNLNFNNASEDEYRLNVYVDKRIDIAKHNAKFARGEVGFTLGENQFTHMLTEEVTDTMNGYNRTARIEGKPGRPAPRPKSTFVLPDVRVPDEVDWRTQGAVTPIKDQGNCSSCYAFSATGALEGMLYLQTGKLVPLSEQNFIDCSWMEGNYGCAGGVIERCFQYVQDNNGTDTEEGYPYTGLQGRCKYSNKSKGVLDYGFINLPAGDENALKTAVATVGPISVAIHGSDLSFHHYSKGVYYNPLCSKTNLTHAILVVGYGTNEHGADYWIVKNSWSPKWGEEGFGRMARNKGNNCGIATQASYPVGVTPA